MPTKIADLNHKFYLYATHTDLPYYNNKYMFILGIASFLCGS